MPLEPATRLAIIAKGREIVALGVPAGDRHHGQASRHGCDCIGLLRLVAHELGLFDASDANPAVRKYLGYGRQPNPQKMHDALAEFLDPLAPGAAQMASVLWFKAGGEPRHLGILTDTGGVIHASATERCVVEMRLPATASRHVLDRARVAAAWDFRPALA